MNNLYKINEDLSEYDNILIEDLQQSKQKSINLYSNYEMDRLFSHN